MLPTASALSWVTCRRLGSSPLTPRSGPVRLLPPLG
jgi:hypothetical protein